MALGILFAIHVESKVDVGMQVIDPTPPYTTPTTPCPLSSASLALGKERKKRGGLWGNRVRVTLAGCCGPLHRTEGFANTFLQGQTAGVAPVLASFFLSKALLADSPKNETCALPASRFCSISEKPLVRLVRTWV